MKGSPSWYRHIYAIDRNGLRTDLTISFGAETTVEILAQELVS